MRQKETVSLPSLRQVLGQSAYLFFASGIASLAMFVVSAFLAQQLSKEAFGTYRFILSVIPLLSIFTLPGVGAALIVAVSQRHRQPSLAFLWRLKFFGGLVALLFGLAVAGYYWLMENETLALAFTLAAFAIPFAEAATLFSFYWKAIKDFARAAMVDATAKILQAVIILAVVWWYPSMFAALAALLASQIIVRSALFLYAYHHQKNAHTQPEDQLPPHLIRYSYYLSATAILAMLLGNMDKWLLWHFGSAEMVALYAVALLIPQALAVHVETTAQVLFPHFASITIDSKAALTQARKLIFHITALAAGLALLLALMLPFIFPYIFPKYTETLPLAQLAFVLLPLSVLQALALQLLYSQPQNLQLHYSKILFFAGLGQLLVFAVLFPLVPLPYAVLFALAFQHAAVAAFTFFNITRQLPR